MFNFLGAFLITTIISTSVFANMVEVATPTEMTTTVTAEDSALIRTDVEVPTMQPNSVALPIPNKLSTATLMNALNQRKSNKSFSDQEIDDATLSAILWSAYGVNRSTGERTIPTAMNKKDLSIYVFTKNGIFKYDAPNNSLISILKEDKRSIFHTQDYMKNVPVILVYTGSMEEYASMHAGSAYQNVELYTAAHDMGSVVRGFFDKEEVKKALNLSNDERVIISQAVGYKSN